MKMLITGAAGFIGYHTVLKILSNKKNLQVVGIDSVNNYYSRELKLARIKNLKNKFKKNFIFKKINISDKKKIFNLFKKSKFHTVI
ncbi:GDP-mannose 4,6-dehydratase, partial [Pelagibacterales bacterium SAG-MED15]|nr:GDP-mannose 4,6-dehydratase [Pelagibacterales bacterium SAG-MED15]